MKRQVRLGWGMMAVLLLVNPSRGQSPYLPSAPCQGPNCNPPWMLPAPTPKTTTPEKTPSTQEGTQGTQTPESTSSEQTPETDSNQQAETGERGQEASYDGPMFGDLVVPAASSVAGVTPQVLGLVGTASHAAAASSALHPLGGASDVAGAVFPFHTAYNIGENEYPKPLDRVFATYNYYSDVAGSGVAFGAPGVQVQRQMAGGEKTFLGGNASVGIRIPIFWAFGSRTVVENQLGDISVVFKYAFYNNRRTGNAVSGGLVVTAPTGPALQVAGQSSINSTVLQPWIGEIWHWGRLYNIDFASIAVPTDARDVTLFFECFALAYLVYRNNDPSRWLHGVVPDFEWHAAIPLDHAGLSTIPIGFPNTVDFTGGCYFFVGHSVCGIGAGMPVTGPNTYSFEALATLNYIF